MTERIGPVGLSLKHRTLVWLAAAMVLGCTSAASESASNQPIDSVAPPSPSIPVQPTSTPAPPSLDPTVAPSSTPVPTAPELATEATGEDDGVEIRLKLEQNPLPAGKLTWATVTIRNRTELTVPWMTDGCAEPAMLIGILGGEWRAGAEQTGIAARFKQFALEPLGHAGQAYLLMGFVSEKYLGRDVGCADLGLLHKLRPGDKLVYRAAWDGALDDLAAPSVPVELIASFPRLVGSRSVPVEVHLDSWIVDGTPFRFLTPAAAIDLALSDPQFVEWLERAPESTWINSTHTLDPDAGTWEIGLFRQSDEGFLGTVTLDARSGEVIAHQFE